VYATITGACDDGNACTSGDTCTSNVCQGTAVSCNDNDACTTDSCNPASGCVNTPTNYIEAVGSKYFLCSSARTWVQAEQYCQGKGYHLVTINGAIEQAALTEVVKGLGYGNVWVERRGLLLQGVVPERAQQLGRLRRGLRHDELLRERRVERRLLRRHAAVCV
jgi:hypothetical protein